MGSLILLAILAALVILCLILVIRWILSQTSTSATITQNTMEQFSQAVSSFQTAQTTQLGEVLDRHSSDIRQILSAQSEYISRFLTGPTIQADSPIQHLPQTDEPDLSDPANWPFEDQLAQMPPSMRREIEREMDESDFQDRLNAPTHPIHHYPGVRSTDPGLSSEENQATWTAPTNGSGPLFSEAEG